MFGCSCSKEFEALEDLLTPNILVWCMIICIDIIENKKHQSEIELLEVKLNAELSTVLWQQ
jgi:hypothetical protein